MKYPSWKTLLFVSSVTLLSACKGGGDSTLESSINSSNAAEILGLSNFTLARSGGGIDFIEDVVDIGYFGASGAVSISCPNGGHSDVTHDDINMDGSWGTGEDISIVYTDCTDLSNETLNGQLSFTNVMLSGDWKEQLGDYSISIISTTDIVNTDASDIIANYSFVGTSNIVLSSSSGLESNSLSSASLTITQKVDPVLFIVDIFPSLIGEESFTSYLTQYSLNWTNDISEQTDITGSGNVVYSTLSDSFNVAAQSLSFNDNESIDTLSGKIIITSQTEASQAIISFDNNAESLPVVDIIRIFLDHDADGIYDDQVDLSMSVIFDWSMSWLLLMMLSVPLVITAVRKRY